LLHVVLRVMDTHGDETAGPTPPGSYVATVKRVEAVEFGLMEYFLLFASAMIWGASFFFTDIGLQSFEPGLVAFLRVAVGCLTVWVLPMQRGSIQRDHWRTVGIVGLLWMALPLTLFALAQQRINSSLAGMLDAATLITTMVFGVAFFGRPVIGKQLTGITFGLIGLLAIAVPEVSTSGTQAMGVAMVIAAVAAYGLVGHIAAPVLRIYGVLPVIRWAVLVAVVATAPYGLLGIADSSFSWKALLACMALGAGGTGLAYVFASALNRRVGAVRASIGTYIIPIVSILLGSIFLDESIAASSLIGTAIVLAGAALATTPERVDD